jgi:hypothetical protein
LQAWPDTQQASGRKDHVFGLICGRGLRQHFVSSRFNRFDLSQSKFEPITKTFDLDQNGSRDGSVIRLMQFG